MNTTEPTPEGSKGESQHDAIAHYRYRQAKVLLEDGDEDYKINTVIELIKQRDQNADLRAALAELELDKEFLKDMIVKVLSLDMFNEETRASVTQQAIEASKDGAILRYKFLTNGQQDKD